MKILSILLFLIGSLGLIRYSSHQDYGEFFFTCVQISLLIWGMNGIITGYNLDKIEYFKKNPGGLYVLFMLLVFVLFCIYCFIFGN